MKQLMVFLCFLMLGSVAMAQAPSHLKGPAAKNYKYWQDKNDQKGSTLVAHETKPQLKGPAAKNKKAWDNKGNQDFHAVKSADRPKNLKGPRYKNLKPWDRIQKANSDVADDAPKRKSNDTTSGSGGQK